MIGHTFRFRLTVQMFGFRQIGKKKKELNTNGWLQQKLPKFGFRTHTTALWPMEQSSILSAKFDCPVARQNFSLVATALT